jgi:hypothetical protein
MGIIDEERWQPGRLVVNIHSQPADEKIIAVLVSDEAIYRMMHPWYAGGDEAA